MSHGKKESKIKMIPIDRINILNPRVRNKKVFADITDNIAQVGLKRPITVTPNRSGSGKDYDLVCGQGRLEAFMACGQTQIPAIIIEADEEQALIMSLVENLARRQHTALDLLKGIDLLRGQGYDAKQIAAKTGLSTEYVTSVLKLMEQGEERLLSAVESGQLPITVALIIMDSPGDEQRALQEAYENKELRGNKLIAVRRLIEQRRRQGKLIKGGGRGGHSKNRKDNQVSARDVMKVYQKEVDRKRLLTRKAENTSSQLLFLTEALRRLFEEEHFTTLLRAEGLDTMPKQLADIMAQKGGSHGF